MTIKQYIIRTFSNSGDAENYANRMAKEGYKVLSVSNTEGRYYTICMELK